MSPSTVPEPPRPLADEPPAAPGVVGTDFDHDRVAAVPAAPAVTVRMRFVWVGGESS